LAVVSIRVEGVSITIVDGHIAIEQTELTAGAATAKDSAAPKVEAVAATSGAALPSAVVAGTALPGFSGKAKPAPASPRNSGKDYVHAGKGREAAERVGLLPEGVDSSAGDLGTGNSTSVIDAPDRPLPPGRNGLAQLPGEAKSLRPGDHSDKGGSGQAAWTDEEIEKLRALYPTHSAGAIAVELGRRLNSVRAKAQHLG
jgi:hypothetical protein